MVRVGLALLLGGLISPSAEAKKPTSSDIPELPALLEAAGWTMTPEMSGAYKPGDIYQAQGHRLWASGADCFPVEPRESPYTSMEVRNRLETGVRMTARVGKAGVGASITKKIVFDDPMHLQLAGSGLTPSDECTRLLEAEIKQGDDLVGMYVIVEVLSARIQKQECGTYDARLGNFVVSSDVKLSQACAQESLEPVAVAYKTIPVRDLHRIREIAPAPTEPVATPEPAAAIGRPTALIAGGVAVVAGSVLVISTSQKYRNSDDIPEDDWSRMQLTNALGWAAMVGGASMVTVQLLDGEQPVIGIQGVW